MAEAAQTQSTRTATTRRLLRRVVAALLLTVPLLAGSLPATATQSSGGTPSSPPSKGTTAQVSREGAVSPAAVTKSDASGPTDISVNQLTPSVPDKGDTLTISGTVTNNSGSTIRQGHVGLRVGPTLGSRSAIEQVADRSGSGRRPSSPEVDGHTANVASLSPGMTRSFTLEMPLEDLDLDEGGVYRLGISFSGETKARPYERVLGIERTFLPWRTSETQEKTKLSMMWPLVSSAHLTARTKSDDQQTPIFRNDELEQAIRPGGRLQQMVALGAELPVTWVIDPDLLASVEAMTKPYRVRTEDGGTVAGTAQARAQQWLLNLQQATEGDDIVALPFADPDLASLAHNGSKVPGALGRLQSATTLASKTVESILHEHPSTEFAWPVKGAIDSAIVDVATSAGAQYVVARSDSLKNNRELSYTPTAARPIGGGTTAVVADYQLSTAFESDLTHAEDATLAVQRFLAHTLAITQQVPSEQRSIVVAPQRRPTVSQAQALAKALGALAESARWTQSASLTEAAQAKPDPDATRKVPSPEAYPEELREQELPTAAYAQIEATQTQLEDFAQVLSIEHRVKIPVGNAITRAMSTAWRGKPEEARQFRDAVQDYLTRLSGKVRLIQKSDLTLSGRSATIPVTVRNDLAQGVDGLRLKLTARRSIGLRIEDDMQRVVVDGGHSQSLKFAVTAKANGRTTVTAQLYTMDGKPYGPPMTFQVKVTSITSTVLLVIAGGVLLVVLAGIRMYTQRKRQAAAVDEESPEEPAEAPAEEPAEKPVEEPAEEPAEDQHPSSLRENEDQLPGDESQREASDANAASDARDEPAGEQPSEPGGDRGDTGTESGGPPDTGEKVDR